ncbi:nitrate reductase molybdenum cofactor assembly chaperone [Oceanobacillus timonensis]|uniref:nitrate reductase molybdenum cofactor assembly chaperone n=1 Tax=Oceanobacillus timonensis TaxID=1926285 RepID=UPI0009BC0C88|nr:nitrate reductase molybdenum cofactor assembly chaperone [Oceanobacillus timonensis]
MNSTIYQLISFLLAYPNQQMKETLPEIREEVEDISNEDVAENLRKFIQKVEDMSLDEWVTYYIDNFDFGRVTNLYVTYLKLGEQRERGLELLKLKKYYEAHGFEVTDKELPDYLPLLLEFCARVPIETSNELLEMHGKTIAEIQKKLREQHNFYYLLFDALFNQMEAHGLHIAAEDAV